MDPFAGPPDKRRAFDDAGQSNGVQRDRMCKRYDTPEGCPFGDRCRFSHGADDPRFKGAANGASQKQPCQKFFSTNGCPYGDTCHFTHHVSGPPPRIIIGSGQSAAAAPLPSYRAPEPDQGQQNMKTRMCRNFQEGNCTFGDRCHFAHGNQEMRAGPPRSAPPSGFTSTMAPEGSGVKEFPLLWGESATDAAGNVTMMATITFPQEMAGSIIGKGGQNVRQIQVTSGAKVTLKPSPADPNNLKDVDIEGTGAAVQSAAGRARSGTSAILPMGKRICGQGQTSRLLMGPSQLLMGARRHIRRVLRVGSQLTKLSNEKKEYID
ncbi:CCCH-type Zn-finger protein [Klebsormidium nitens]|uniref:CCCH-type Zn-finger protein n=1 Tax=Klebsormidium nitens TaxID=105231 RepID=A0A1Y1HMZ7_KLENI|nr:CCCH-type Zn-finger protein [Klebsormidium nitens]|eukprot:GAQ78559.1 CCCH-type Zn-finger protein [Klebsormidium nitens]